MDKIPASLPAEGQEILSGEACQFLAALHLRFNPERTRLLERRKEIAAALDCGSKPEFPAETESVRSSAWQVAPVPRALSRRRVEITAPCDAKMMVHAFNSGADLFMADLEDSLSPTWANVVTAQINLKAAANRTLMHATPEGKVLSMNENAAMLAVRPRGWHLEEKHFVVNGQPISASLFDFGLFLFHSGRALQERGEGPYFYLPKLENHLEARLWNEVFVFAQDALGIPQGSIRATVLIENVLAAFEMEEILFELRDHAAGLNAGRWDYLFSVIKKLRRLNPLFPDRERLTMDLPFLQSYCELLVQTCHARGAHAIGGMSAFIPSRREPEVNANALRKIREDKERELALGFDGTWVAHPDLVRPVLTMFEERLGGADHQKHVLPVRSIGAEDLLPREIPVGITDRGVTTNVRVALRYLNRWLGGQGAVALHNLMEDAATAEISRAQLWQWIKRAAPVEGNYLCSEARFRWILEEEIGKLEAEENLDETRKASLREIMEKLVLSENFPDFLTTTAYEHLLQHSGAAPLLEERDEQQENRMGNLAPLEGNREALLSGGSGETKAVG